ncbi:MAG TPA: RsmE family RNA methyltransferase [Candidatus Binatia bacterium]|nr:RsmE family RNA methyltransferase [Candidatus Binatia bacterium]
MTRRRWIADEVLGDRAALVGDHAAHLVRVLRARIGQEFDISTGDSTRRGRIISIGENRVEFDLAGVLPANPLIDLTLLLSIFKFDRMEWAIEKCTELGAARIVPVIAERSDSHLAAASAKRVERWRRIAHESAEQSRRSSPPEIDAPLKLSEALSYPCPRIVLSELEPEKSLRDVLNGSGVENGVALAIGPEGGWTDRELERFFKAGWTSASLGKTIVRAETAAIAAVAIAFSLFNPRAPQLHPDSSQHLG